MAAVSTSATLNDFPSTLSRAWTWGRRALWAAAAGCALLIVLEAIHLHQLLERIHPVAAWTATGIVAAALLYGAGRAVARYLSVPRVVVPPDLPALSQGWDAAQRQCHRDFAARYLRRQSRNPHLDPAARATIPQALAAIDAALAGVDAADPVRAARALNAAVETELARVLAPLDRTAKRLIRRTAVEVSVATAVSPSILLDSLITLSRNVNMISKIADLYYGRPGLFGTLRIVRDVVGAAVAAGALEVVTDNLASAASEITGSWSSRLLGPLGQGAVNGVVTMRLGAAGRQRCRSLTTPRVPWRPWRLADYRRGISRLMEWISEDVGPWFTQPLARWVGRTEPAAAPAADGEPAERASRRNRWWQRVLPGGEPRRPAAPGGAPAPEGADPLLDSDLLD